MALSMCTKSPMGEDAGHQRIPVSMTVVTLWEYRSTGPQVCSAAMRRTQEVLLNHNQFWKFWDLNWCKLFNCQVVGTSYDLQHRSIAISVKGVSRKALHSLLYWVRFQSYSQPSALSEYVHDLLVVNLLFVVMSLGSKDSVIIVHIDNVRDPFMNKSVEHSAPSLLNRLWAQELFRAHWP